MNQRTNPSNTADALPRAIVKKDHLSSLLWLVPAAAAALCVWFLYRDFVATGPLVTISFQDVEGLQTQNTPLLFRGMIVGMVKEVNLAKDEKSVEVKVRLIGAAKDMARAGSAFWIVHPDVRIGSISGLRTLVSGQYIEIRPGPGQKTNRFQGLWREPLPERPEALEIVLVSPHLASLQEQSPIFYRGIQVGEVTHYQLGADSRTIRIHARIWREYAPLVHAESKFWNAGGLAVHFGLFKGMQISAESPKTIITGGLEFATPPEPSTPATNGSVFIFNEKAEEKWKEWNPIIRLEAPTNASPNMTLQTNVWPILNDQ